MNTSYKKAHIIVKGIVQGVGFRFYTQHRARQYGIYGWVRNLPDGDVEILAEGKDGVIDEFIKDVKKGPSMARVFDMIVEINDIERPSSMDFRIRY